MSLINIANYSFLSTLFTGVSFKIYIDRSYDDYMLLKLNVHFSGLLVHFDRDEGPMCLTVYSADPL